MSEEPKGPLCFCGLRQTKNPHPEAGVPPGYLEVGTVYDCIPCLNKSRRAWSKRANKAEGQLKEGIAFLEKLRAAAGDQSSVATGYLSDILEVLQGLQE